MLPGPDLPGQLKLTPLLTCCFVPVAIILGAGLMAHWRVLGRHFAPLMPVVCLTLIAGLAALFAGGRFSRVVAFLFCGLMVLSSLSLRFAPRHGKDDYRSAAAEAVSAFAQGKRVWWNAAEEGARYYRVPVTKDPANTDAALLLINPSAELLQHAPIPDLIIASRPDVYDSQTTVASYVVSRSFRMDKTYAAFQIWKRTSSGK